MSEGEGEEEEEIVGEKQQSRAGDKLPVLEFPQAAPFNGTTQALSSCSYWEESLAGLGHETWLGRFPQQALPCMVPSRQKTLGLKVHLPTET